MKIRELSGMNYYSIEIDHLVMTPMHEVLRELADWLEDNNAGGLLTNVTTQSHPEEEDRFLTTLVWAV